MNADIFKKLFEDEKELRELKNQLTELNNDTEMLDEFNKANDSDLSSSTEIDNIIEILELITELLKKSINKSQQIEEIEKTEEEEFLSEEDIIELNDIEEEIEQQEQKSEELDLSEIKPEPQALNLDNINPEKKPLSLDNITVSRDYEDDEELYYDDFELTRFGRFLKKIHKPAKGIFNLFVLPTVFLAALHFSGGTLMSLVPMVLPVITTAALVAFVAVAAETVYFAYNDDGEGIGKQNWFQKKLEKRKEKKAEKKQSKKPNRLQKWNQKRKENKATKKQQLDPAVELARQARIRDDKAVSTQTQVYNSNQQEKSSNDISPLITQLQELKVEILNMCNAAVSHIDTTLSNIANLQISEYNYGSVSNNFDKKNPTTTVKSENNTLKKAM